MSSEIEAQPGAPATEASAHPSDARGEFIAIAVILGAVFIWASWIISTRWAVSGALVPLDVGILRYGIPALVLLPVWLPHGLLPVGLSPRVIAGMVLGAGIPFFLIGASGMKFAPVSDVGAMLPGTMSFFVAIGAKLVEREVFGKARTLGFALIAAGVVVIAWGSLTGGSGAWRGHLLFLSASAIFAIYTFSFIRSGLKPFHAVGLVSAWSTVLAIPAWLLFTPPGLPEIGLGQFALLALIQGILSGVVAIAAFAFAVQKIGASKAAAYSALVPVLTALLGIPVLGEWPTAVGWAGGITVSFGVLLASGAINWGQLAQSLRFVPKGEAR